MSRTSVLLIALSLMSDSERNLMAPFLAASHKRKRDSYTVTDMATPRASTSASASATFAENGYGYSNGYAWAVSSPHTPAPASPTSPVVPSTPSRRHYKRLRYSTSHTNSTVANGSGLFADRTSSTSPSESSSPSPSPEDERAEAGPSDLTPQVGKYVYRKTARGIGRKVAQMKKEREGRWRKWCDAHVWESQHDPGYKQKAGGKEVHRSEAMSYFRLKEYEVDTLPHTMYDCDYKPLTPGRWYNLANLHALVARKHAVLAGLDERLDPKTQEVEFLRRGWELYTADTKKYTERLNAKGKKRKELVFAVVFVPQASSPHHGRPRHSPDSPSSASSSASTPSSSSQGKAARPRPDGSWTSRVYEDGLYTGEWLHLQLDPDAGEYEDFYIGYERFRSRKAEWVWC